MLAIASGFALPAFILTIVPLQLPLSSECPNNYWPPAMYAEPPSSPVPVPVPEPAPAGGYFPSLGLLNCYRFNHDMTAFLAVGGLWLIAAITGSMLNVAAAYMFYWRKLTRVALLFNVIFAIISLAVINWNVIFISYAYEDENWQLRDGSWEENVGRESSLVHHLRTSASAFLATVCFLCFFSACASLLLYLLRKFLLAKPRYCCWPAACCQPPLLRPHTRSLPPSADLSYQGHDSDDEDYQFQESSRKKDADDAHKNDLEANTALQPDLTPLLSSLQGIQSTITALAAKVEVLEHRSNPTAEVHVRMEANDPFAYGRAPPAF